MALVEIVKRISENLRFKAISLIGGSLIYGCTIFNYGLENGEFREINFFERYWVTNLAKNDVTSLLGVYLERFDVYRTADGAFIRGNLKILEVDEERILSILEMIDENKDRVVNRKEAENKMSELKRKITSLERPEFWPYKVKLSQIE